MAAQNTAQERLLAMAASGAAVVLAGLAWVARPEPGAFVEAEPDAYVLFQQVLHGAVLLVLVVLLARLPAMTAGRPGLRALMAVVMLAGVAAAALVLAMDFDLL